MNTAPARPRTEDRTRREPARDDKLGPVLERIREDAQRAPDRWLRDAEVPGGGE